MIVPTIIRYFRSSLTKLEISFDGGISSEVLSHAFPATKLDSLNLHDHYLPPSDDPKLRPRIFDLADKILAPNEFRLRSLKIDYYRNSIERLLEFLQNLDKTELISLHLVVFGNYEESDKKY